jgi:acetyl esterase/lipase
MSRIGWLGWSDRQGTLPDTFLRQVETAGHRCERITFSPATWQGEALTWLGDCSVEQVVIDLPWHAEAGPLEGQLLSLRQFCSACRERGLRLIMVGEPPRPAQDAEAALAAHSHEHRVEMHLPLIDPRQVGLSFDPTLFSAPAEPGVERRAGLVYRRIAGRPLVLDCYRPAGVAGPLPCLFWIHGGGWETGGIGETAGNLLPVIEAGVMLVRMEYRLSREAVFPACLEDVRAAIAFACSRGEELGLDVERLAIGGASAGGHLALLASLIDPPLGLQAVVAWCAPSDLSSLLQASAPPEQEGDTPIHRLLGWPCEDFASRCRAASPIHHLSGDGPRIFLAHGALDEVVPLEQSRALATALNELGRSLRVRIVNDCGHNLWAQESASQPIADFLAEELFSPSGS